MLRVLDLFSGIGGFSLGLEWAGGFRTVAFCEIDRYCQKVLKKHWCNAPIIPDIRDERLKEIQADVITGGFPCQPVSCAGKRRGTEDDRWLWPEMLAVISAVRPTWVIGENVTGIVRMVKSVVYAKVESRTLTRTPDYDLYKAVLSQQEMLLLDGICGELEAEGYAVQPLIIPACGVGAYHRRKRVWLVAHAEHRRPQERWGQGNGQMGRSEGTRAEASLNLSAPKKSSSLAIPASRRRKKHTEHDGKQKIHPSVRHTCRLDTDRCDYIMADASRFCCNRPGHTGEERRAKSSDEDSHVPHNESEQMGATRQPRQHRSIPGEWLAEPDVGRVADGIPARVDRLRALGNAIVPQIAEMIGQGILAAERNADER